MFQGRDDNNLLKGQGRNVPPLFPTPIHCQPLVPNLFCFQNGGHVLETYLPVCLLQVFATSRYKDIRNQTFLTGTQSKLDAKSFELKKPPQDLKLKTVFYLVAICYKATRNLRWVLWILVFKPVSNRWKLKINNHQYHYQKETIVELQYQTS